MTRLELILLLLQVSLLTVSGISYFFDYDLKPVKDVPELIRSQGYPVEVHKVVTKDGYILELHRIPGPRPRHKFDGRGKGFKKFKNLFDTLLNDTSNHLALPRAVHNVLNTSLGVLAPILLKVHPRQPDDRTWPYRRDPRRPRPAVLVHHGLFASSSNFVLSDANAGALAYLLADAGYDVWLANWRGNSYSRGHVNLDPDHAEFWDFSLDEIMRYDVPAMIDYVINTSGQRRIFFIGHSLGCAMFFGANSYRPDLSSKVRLMIAMAPAAFMDNSQGILKSTILSIKNYYRFADWLGVPDVPIPIPWRTQLVSYFCGSSTVFRLPCLYMMDYVMGKVHPQTQEYYTRVLLSHFPGTVASTRIIAHFGQFVDSGGMHRFDFGTDENYRRYNQSSPPRYDLGAVKCPVAVMWGPGDTVITPEDVSQCVHMLPNVILNYRVPDSSFNHLDFIFPEQAEDIVYRPIMALLTRY